MRELAFSVKLKDCEVQTFSVSGSGGQNRDRRSTGVRIIHHPSGARGEATEQRSQHQNKREAMKRMAESPLFKAWVSAILSKTKTPKQLEEEVDTEIADPKITKVEVKNKKGVWIDESA